MFSTTLSHCSAWWGGDKLSYRLRSLTLKWLAEAFQRHKKDTTYRGFELFCSFSKENRNSYCSKSDLSPYRLLFQPLILECALITGDYGILRRNMQHWLNWDRKEYIFQYLLSTIVLDFMELQMITTVFWVAIDGDLPFRFGGFACFGGFVSVISFWWFHFLVSGFSTCLPKVASYLSYQNSIIRKKFNVPFLKYKYIKLNLRVFLASHTVAMVAYRVIKMITMIGQLFWYDDCSISWLITSGNNGTSKSTSWKMLKLLWATLMLFFDCSHLQETRFSGIKVIQKAGVIEQKRILTVRRP